MAETIVTSTSPTNMRIKRWESLQIEKQGFSALHEDIRKLVRPNAGEFAGQLALGSNRALGIYDDTAMLANVSLSSALSSYITPPNMRWLNVTLKKKHLMERHEVLLFCELISDAIYAKMAIPEAQFYTQGDEANGDICSLGTAVEMPRRNPRTGVIVSKTYPLNSICFATNDFGIIDTAYRECEWTVKEAIQRFGKDALPAKMLENYDKDPFKKFKFLHSVEPREVYNISKWDNKNKPFASYWDSIDFKEPIYESGFDEFPYIISRLFTVPSETLGRSFAMNCLPSIKVLNEAARLRLQALQLSVAPPWVADNDGWVNTFQLIPHGMTFRDDPNSKIERLLDPIDLSQSDELMNEYRQRILQSFFIDKLMLQKNNVEMKQVEIMQRIDEGLRGLSPQITRLQSERLGPTIKVYFNEMLLNGDFNHIDVPPILDGLSWNDIDVEYVSPAAKAQLGGKNVAIERFLQSLNLIAAVDQTAYDVVNFKRLGSEMALNGDVSRKILNSQEEYDVIQGQRASEKQAAMMAQIGKTVSGATKDFASAQKDVAAANAM